MTNVVIFPESSIDSLWAEAIFLQELGAEEFLASLCEVSVGLSQAEFDVHVLEEGKHDLELGNLALLIKGQDISILGQIWHLKLVGQGVAEIRPGGYVGAGLGARERVRRVGVDRSLGPREAVHAAVHATSVEARRLLGLCVL